jgi:hypothetical protein
MPPIEESAAWQSYENTAQTPRNFSRGATAARQRRGGRYSYYESAGSGGFRARIQSSDRLDELESGRSNQGYHSGDDGVLPLRHTVHTGEVTKKFFAQLAEEQVCT